MFAEEIYIYMYIEKTCNSKMASPFSISHLKSECLRLQFKCTRHKLSQTHTQTDIYNPRAFGCETEFSQIRGAQETPTENTMR